jgi:hypothetical protein
MGSGVNRMMTGSIVASGSAMNIDVVGFRPSRVLVQNVSAPARGEWQDTMADAAALKTVTAGTVSFITSDGITPRAAGFTLGADADLNTATEVVHWTAWE